MNGKTLTANINGRYVELSVAAIDEVIASGHTLAEAIQIVASR